MCWHTPVSGIASPVLGALARFAIKDVLISADFRILLSAEVSPRAAGPGPRRQARWAGRGSRVNGAPQARPA